MYLDKQADYDVRVSYIQSVKEVVFRLLVLQEQLKVFKDLVRNQQRFIRHDITFTLHYRLSVQGCTITFLPGGGAILFVFMMTSAGGLLQVNVSFLCSSVCKWGCREEVQPNRWRPGVLKNF